MTGDDLVLIPGDTHCYDYHLDLVLDAVREWMQDRVSSGPVSKGNGQA